MVAAALGMIVPSASAGWGIVEQIDLGAVQGDLDIAVNGAGAALAVWSRNTDNNIYAARHVPGLGWRPAGLIERGSGYAVTPSAGVGDTGRMMAVWQQDTGGVASAFANAYDPATGWGTEIEVDGTATQGITGVVFAMSRTGFAVASWHQFDVGQVSVYANRYAPGVGWDTATLLETSTTDGSWPAAAIDPGGNATVVFSPGNALMSSRYAVGLGWTSAQVVRSGTGTPQWQEVAMDASGRAIAAWAVYESTRWELFASRYVPGVGWGASVSLEPRAIDVLDLDVAVAPSGDGVVVWRDNDVPRNILASTFTVASGWGFATFIETLSQEASSPRVSIGPQGDAVAVWYQYEGTLTNVWGARHVPATGWGPAELIEIENAGQVRAPTVAVDDGGNAYAIWSYQGGVWANTYVVPDTTPPALVLTSPANGATVATASVSVAGTVEPRADVVVNGIRPAVAVDGTFSFLLALGEGTNVITATATDAAGNQATATRTVTYASPISGLQQDLRDARDAHNATQAELEAARADLAALEDALLGSQDGLTQANEDLSALRGLVYLLLVLVVVQVIGTAGLVVLGRRKPTSPGPPPPPA